MTKGETTNIVHGFLSPKHHHQSSTCKQMYVNYTN